VRHGVTTTLGPLDIALLRYLIPALVLLPVWWRAGLRPGGVPVPALSALVLSGGLPFGLLVLAGAQWAPAAHIAVFTSGTIPLFAALLAWLAWGERIGAARWAGFSLIVAGAAMLASRAGLGDTGAWRGDVLFLLAALCWAVHTHVFRRSGLGPWQGAAIANGGSALLLLAIVPFFAGSLRLHTAPWQDIVFQGVWQACFAGLLGLVAYMAAVRRLGSARAALSASAVPPMTALGEVVFLHVPAQPVVMAAAALVAAGVVLASGAIAWRRTAAA
jgi:drug/metabolite transporter (DMT)-like permease